MRKQLASIFTAMAICLAMITTGVTAADKLPPLGQGITIWFDTGGPVGGPYNTIVQNGAMQAASDLGVDVKYLYSDWNPEKMVDNLKMSIAASPDGVVVMGHPGDNAFAPFIDEAFNKGIVVTFIDTGLLSTLKKYKSRRTAS